MNTMTDEEFSKEFYKKPKVLDRIKFCITHERYHIWTRSKDGKANLPGPTLIPILDLPDDHKVTKKPRISGGDGSYDCYEMVYSATLYGREIEVYFKGYFEKTDNDCGGLVTIGIEVQSVRDNRIR